MSHPILDAARATIERINEKEASGWTSDLRYEQRDADVRHSDPVMTAGERWRHDMGELYRARDAERERDSVTERTIAQQAAMIATLRTEVAQALHAVNGLAKAIRDRIDDLADDVAALQESLASAEKRLFEGETFRKVNDARYSDLQRSLMGKTNSEDVQFIMTPLFAQLETLRGDITKLKALSFLDGKAQLS